MNANTVALWIDNDRDALEMALEIARETIDEPATATALERWIECVLNPARSRHHQLVQTLVDQTLASIDWRDLAAHYRAKVAEGVT